MLLTQYGVTIPLLILQGNHTVSCQLHGGGCGGRWEGEGGGGEGKEEEDMGMRRRTTAPIYGKTTGNCPISSSCGVVRCGTRTSPFTPSMISSGLEIWQWTYVT